MCTRTLGSRCTHAEPSSAASRSGVAFGDSAGSISSKRRGPMISFAETKKNARLTHFEGIKDIVIANTVKNVPEIKKSKTNQSNKSLSEYQS